MTWSEITEDSQTGGADILSYRLDWDNGTNQMIWTTIVGYDSAYIGTAWIQGGTVPGDTYFFRMAV